MLKKMHFKTHNIVLSDGQMTIPLKTPLANRPVIKVIKNTLDNFVHVSPEDRKNIKVVDIGCMEGGYTTEFARMGFDTLGIDARKENLLKAMYVKMNLKLNNLNFVCDDARNLSKYGMFDVVFCFGLLYHLDKPFEFLKTLYSQTKRILILQTFYSPDKDIFYNIEYKLSKIFPNHYKSIRKQFHQKEVEKDKHVGFLQHIKNFKLSPKIVENEGYKGRWFREWNENTNKDKIEVMPGASYNNHQSFWFCKDELIRALYDCGFDNIYEQHDDIGDLAKDTPQFYYPRTLLIAVKNK